MPNIKHPLTLALAATLCLPAFVRADDAKPDAQTRALLDKLGTWDGTTEAAKLETPYETHDAIPSFGLITYWQEPWRSYMDTHSLHRLDRAMGINWNIDPKYADATAQLMAESGIRTVRFEIGWNVLTWDEQLDPNVAASMRIQFAAFKKYGLRPMILLNANSGGGGINRGVPATLVADAKKGDHVLKLKPEDAKVIHAGYTGPMDPAYIAADPMITKVDADGTAHLSAPLGKDIPTGPTNFIELKYQPLQGSKFKDGTPVPESQATLDGWKRYVSVVGNFAREALGTQGQSDSGFDVEVWNELTFGSSYLDINNYYETKREYAEDISLKKTRPWQVGFRPDARTDFSLHGGGVLLGLTADVLTDPANGFKGVLVDDGFGNQAPWSNKSDTWLGEGALSRHYYTGEVKVVTPKTPVADVTAGSLDALGKFNGIHEGDWWQARPGSSFVPTFILTTPEIFHFGMKTETVSRDLIPDSRLSGLGGHGRFTNNGDLRPAQMWQTEVEYDRSAFVKQIQAESGAKDDDPRLIAAAMHLAGKTTLRQYLFHVHKGFDRIYIFAVAAAPLYCGPLPPSFYAALDKSNDQLTPAVRASLPPYFAGFAWLNKQREASENITAPRPLRVDALVEHKPRLVFAGDGTPAHPSKYNRDQFAFLPFQQSDHKFLIPYYVATLNVIQSWDKTKNALDPTRYDMPAQDFDVTIGNCNGVGAKVSALDPLTNTPVPVQVLSATATTLTVRLPTTDSPRFLQVEEAKPGLSILDPQVVAEGDGARISWKTNVPVGAARVTYGPDWTARDSNEIQLQSKGQTQFSLHVPFAANMMAARIRVAAGGLSNVWPRWDEDPQGQISFRPDAQAVPGGALQTVASRASEDFQSATGSYEARTLPDKATPAWGVVALTAPTGVKIENGVLNVDTTQGPEQAARWTLGNIGVSEARGYTVELKLQVPKFLGTGASTDVGFNVQVFGETQLMQVDIGDKQISVRNNKTYDFNFADAPHLVRMVKHAGESVFDVYVDGRLLASGVGTLGAGGQSLNIGDVNANKSSGAKVLLSYARLDNTGAYKPGAKPLTVAFNPSAEIALPQRENAACGFSFKLPIGAVGKGDPDDRFYTVGGITLRVRYIPGAASNLDAYLPTASITDSATHTRVRLPDGTIGTRARFDLSAVAHPGMTNLAQRFLLVKQGADLISLSVSGTPEAVHAQDATITAIFASLATTN